MSQRDEWRDVPNFESFYKVSADGEILSLPRKWSKGRVLKKSLDRYGYEKVVLFKNNKKHHFLTHRVVAIAFIPQIEGKTKINHKNAIRSDNRVENLEWVTSKENSYHSQKLGNAAIKMQAVESTNLQTNEKLTFTSQREAAKLLGISQGSISIVLRGKYTHSCGYKFRYTQEAS